ncbi:MAG: D-glucuronyl C5-epimerase family protein [Solirubrobacteraceae bacterium]
MIKPESLRFPPLHCSLDRRLGDYYQDFSQATVLVEAGYHGGIDAAGVPVTRSPDQIDRYNAITTAQYALANMTAFRRGERRRGELARAQADSLLATQERHGDWAGCWLMTSDSPKYQWLRAPWASALASGNALSALLRAWELFGEQRYRTAADAAYAGLHVPRRSMQLVEDLGDELWYEEYPARPPVRVLNGHVYCMLGVLDYARVTGDSEAEDRWQRAARTVRGHLHEFDLGYWSTYDLRWREPATIHYHNNIHIPQLRILATLTSDGEFTKVADRWQRRAQSPLTKLRWNIAIRVHPRRRTPPWASPC